MTVLRFALLSVIALTLVSIGGVLWFDPAPAAPAPYLTTAPDVLLSFQRVCGHRFIIATACRRRPRL